MKITAKSRLHSRMNSYLMMLLIICLAGLLGWLSTRYSLEMDWTQTGRHTLSDTSKEVLARMPEQIEITAYALEEGNIRDAVKKDSRERKYSGPSYRSCIGFQNAQYSFVGTRARNCHHPNG